MSYPHSSHQYTTQQAGVPIPRQSTGASAIPQGSWGPQVSPRPDYPQELTGYSSSYPYTGASQAHAQQGYAADPYNPGGFLAPGGAQQGTGFTDPYPPSPGSVHRSRSGQSSTSYNSSGGSIQHSYSGQQPAAYYPPQQTYDSTTSYPVAQPTSTHHVASHGQSRSHGSRSDGSHIYASVPPVASGSSYPTQERGVMHSQPQYEYDDGGQLQVPVHDHRSKSPGRGPVQGRQHVCRMPRCNQPMYFDRRFNEFWEWCSAHHVQGALSQGIEKVCKHCGVWPRKYGYKYCGGSTCNKKGIPMW